MPNQVLDKITLRRNNVDEPYFISNSVNGYYNSTDGKFYKESTFTTEVNGISRLVYVDLSTNYIYRYDDLNTEFVQIGGSGSASAAIEYVNSLPSSDIKDVIYGIISRTSYTATVGADFLDSDESFEKTEGTDGAYTYTAAEGAEIEASTDGTTYKGFTSLAFDGTDWTLTYSDSTSTPIAAAASFYYKKVNRMYYAGNETEQSITPFASGGSGGGGATYMPGEGVNINNNVISLSPATSSTLGGVKTDNSTIVADANGTISGNYQAGFNVDIDGNTIKTKEFVGTTTEWNSLTAAQKAQYTFTMFSDDFSPVDATPGHGIADSTGAEKTQRNTLQFGNEMEVTDDSTNEVTKVNVIPYTAGDKIDITNHEISVDETVKTTFIGTTAEWETLTTTEKAEYELVSLTDDPAGGDMYVEDTITEDSINPVTSGAVYDALVNKQDKTDNSLNTTAKTVVGAINELKSGKQDNLVISSTTSVSVGGGFTGGSGVYYKYGRLVFFSFNCYYAGALAANTNHTPFSGLPKALYNDNTITVSNGGYAARTYVNTEGKLILNPWQQIPANSYLAGTVIYLSAT